MPSSDQRPCVFSNATMQSGLSGELRAASDKSISHRALMFAALAQGRSHIHHLLNAEDIRATAHVLQQLGVAIRQNQDETIIDGVGLMGLKPATSTLR